MIQYSDLIAFAAVFIPCRCYGAPQCYRVKAPPDDARITCGSRVVWPNEQSNAHEVVQESAIADSGAIAWMLPASIDRITYDVYAQRLSFVGAYMQ